MPSNAIPPSVTPPSPFEFPETVLPITGIARNSPYTTITSPSHGLTADCAGTTFVFFKQVGGMRQINGLNALILTIPDANTFTVNIDSTNFYNYTSGGVFILDTSVPAVQQQGFQVFNRPFQNIA